MRAVTITLPDGTKIEGDSGKEVGEAARVLRAAKIVPTEPPPPRVNFGIQRNLTMRDISDGQSRGNGIDVETTTLELLEAIKTAGNHGLAVDKVQKIVHANTGKGIGGRMVRINGYLRHLGFADSKELFDNPKDRKTGARVWKPKSKLDAAIDAAREAINGKSR